MMASFSFFSRLIFDRERRDLTAQSLNSEVFPRGSQSDCMSERKQARSASDFAYRSSVALMQWEMSYTVVTPSGFFKRGSRRAFDLLAQCLCPDNTIVAERRAATSSPRWPSSPAEEGGFSRQSLLGASGSASRTC